LSTRRIAVGLACTALAATGLSASASSGSSVNDPLEPIVHRGDRYVPKPAGTVEDMKFWFGPYHVPPGHDANRVDIDLPIRDGFILAIEPGMRYAHNLEEPTHQEAHIHHAHWFALDPGNQEDNYTGGNTEWIFGNGDEETRADFQERSAADPNGPIYGQYIGAGGPQLMIYMLHNKTSQPLNVYIVLDVTFKHGTQAELAALGGRPHHDTSGVLFGRTFDVPRQADGDGIFSTTHDFEEPIEWTATISGTMIGTGSHVHPGGLRVITENMGSKQNPCPDDGQGTGGTTLLKSDAIWRNATFSEDFQMEVTHPAWRAPVHKGDRIRITGLYENKDHAWYTAMTHNGIYIDEAQPPKGRCTPTLINQPERKVTIKRKRHKHVRWVRHIHRGSGARNSRVHMHKRVRIHIHKQRLVNGIDPTEGVPNRAWGTQKPDAFCGPQFGGPPCDQPEPDRGPGRQTNQVTIANFLYVPGDRSLSGSDGAPVQVKKGTALEFFNADQAAGIRHSVTTCAWPCNGRYVANYPWADGRWDSGTLGYDAIDGGSPNPFTSTPKELPVGKYAYFCRIHPWMRGAFEVVP
jgi:plastocyanin